MKVSVVMSVYNGLPYLQDSIDSILSQSWRDFEFIIVNDGSDDGSSEVLSACALKDARIRVMDNGVQLGLAASLNRGVRAAEGAFIARQDADDESMSERLAEQVRFLDENPGIDLLGTRSVFMDQDGADCFHQGPIPDSAEGVRRTLVKGKMLFAHGSMMCRRGFFDSVGFYNEAFIFGQDSELWLRAIQKDQKLAVLPRACYRFRMQPVYSTRKRVAQLYLKKRRLEALASDIWPAQVDEEDLKSVLAKDSREVPFPVAAYHLNLAILIIKRRFISWSAWSHLWRSLRRPDHWYAHLLKLLLLGAPLYPFKIGMRLPQAWSARLLAGKKPAAQ